MNLTVCDAIGLECFYKYSLNAQTPCLKACEGTYADVRIDSNDRTMEWNERMGDEIFNSFVKEYLQYKRNFENDFGYFFKEISLNPEWPFINDQIRIYKYTKDEMDHYSNKRILEVVKIYFQTPTFDQVTRDARTDMVTKLSLIGGTLGLFTGFSFVSGMELIHFIWEICKSLSLQ